MRSNTTTIHNELEE